MSEEKIKRIELTIEREKEVERLYNLLWWKEIHLDLETNMELEMLFADLLERMIELKILPEFEEVKITFEIKK